MRNKLAHLAEDNLWGQIFWSAAQCPGPALYTFGEAEICNLKDNQEKEADKESFRAK